MNHHCLNKIVSTVSTAVMILILWQMRVVFLFIHPNYVTQTVIPTNIQVTNTDAKVEINRIIMSVLQ